MRYLTDDEWREHDIIDIHTEYYDLSSKYFFPHLLLSELMKSKTQPESEIIEYKDDFFDECFYYYYFLGGEKSINIFYRADDIVVYTEVFVKKDFDVDRIFLAIRDLAAE